MTTNTTILGDKLGEYLLKIVMVGNSSVGKTSLLLRYTEDCFSESFIATIGVDFKIKTLDMPDCTAKLQIWDTAGQDRFKTIVSSFYRNTDGLIVVFDLTNADSFRGVEGWLKEAEHYGNEDCIKVLVGNKSDMTAKRVVDFDTAQAFADKLGIPYIETSAKNATNVHQAFTSMADTLVAHKKESGQVYLSPDPDSKTVDIKSTQVQVSWCWGPNTCSMV